MRLRVKARSPRLRRPDVPARPQRQPVSAPSRPQPALDRLNISVFGLGYVGCVTSACLAAEAHQVIGVDVDPHKLEAIRAGKSPIVEGGLDDLLVSGLASGCLRVTEDTRDAVMNSDVSIVCVATPSAPNGSINFAHVEAVCRQIGQAMAAKGRRHTVVIRSTVLPGTCEERLLPILEQESGKRAGRDFGLCMNPEFLRESTAIEDFYQPEVIVIGELDEESGVPLRRLYAEFPGELVRTDLRTAEMVKYANNAWHALKVTFANEIGMVSRRTGVDSHQVMRTLCLDRKLNLSPYYMKPGFAFGGSCLPKDLRALLWKARSHDVHPQLLDSILPSNAAQIRQTVELIRSLGHKKIGLIGLSFKAGTDDLRESPMVELAESLLGKGYELAVYDPNVTMSALFGSNLAYIQREIPHLASLMRSDLSDLVEAADVVVVASGGFDKAELARLVRPGQIVVDLARAIDRNAIDGEYVGLYW